MAIVITELGGNCPVQGEGTFDGVPFYFRARGNHWACRVGGSTNMKADDCIYGPGAHWSFVEEYGDEPYEAGWMEPDEARGFIHQAYERWVAERGTAAPAAEQEGE